MTAPETRHEETLRSALMCSRKSFVCVHGDHEIDAADITALLTVIAALRAEVATLREAVRLASVRLGILVARMRGCHEETGQHELLDEAQMFVDEALAAYHAATQGRTE